MLCIKLLFDNSVESEKEWADRCYIYLRMKLDNFSGVRKKVGATDAVYLIFMLDVALCLEGRRSQTTKLRDMEFLSSNNPTY